MGRIAGHRRPRVPGGVRLRDEPDGRRAGRRRAGPGPGRGGHGRHRRGMTVAVAHPLLTALAPVAAALGATVVEVDDLEPGDLPLEWEGHVVGGLRVAGLHGALGRLLEQAERDMGLPLADLDRDAKQEVVRRLDEQGAFTIRRAVEEVADVLGVSRFTIYN